MGEAAESIATLSRAWREDGSDDAALALAQAHITLADVDAVAVTRGPGLAGSLVVGMNAAKGLALGAGIPLVGVNHLEGHIYSSWVYDAGEVPPPAPQFPLLALLVSGGHTELNLMTDHLTYKRLGSTLDDAAGEAFDKVARLLGLSYPGGPSIQKAAEEGDPTRFKFPRARLEGTWDFSFSGLKTAVALKFFDPASLQDEKKFLRVQREINLSRRISDPRIIRIFSLENWSGIWFMVMERVESLTLKGAVGAVLET